MAATRGSKRKSSPPTKSLPLMVTERAAVRRPPIEGGEMHRRSPSLSRVAFTMPVAKRHRARRPYRGAGASPSVPRLWKPSPSTTRRVPPAVGPAYGESADRCTLYTVRLAPHPT